VPQTPLSHWIGFHLALVILLTIELIYARREKRMQHDPHRTAVAATGLWIAAALALSLYVRHAQGPAASVQYLTGYILEESMSADNLFVFLLLFRLFRIADAHQPRVLFWGVAGAIVMRGLFIAGGLSLLAHFHFVSYIFAAILLVTAVRLLVPSKPTDTAAEPRWITWLKRVHPLSPRQDRFFVFENGRPTITVLLLALIAIELTDVVFALDSIPAVLSITRQPFLAYTSNIMAVMGLRSLYFLIIGMLARLRFLHYGLATILLFAAVKILAASWIEISPLLSLAVILSVLGITVAASFVGARTQKP
jgi:tellurite resistance protein TerC